MIILRMGRFFFFFFDRDFLPLKGILLFLFVLALLGTVSQGEDKVDSTTTSHFRTWASRKEDYIERDQNIRNLMVAYPHSIPLSTENTPNGLDLHWRIDDEASRIYLAFAYTDGDMDVEESAIGWLAFGIGEAGGMPGADMVVIENLGKNHEEQSEIDITDRYSTAYEMPLVDPDNKCDWKLENVHRWSIKDDESQNPDLNGTSSDIAPFSILVVEVSRALTTGDGRYDRPIRYDASWDVPPHRILMAWGSTNQMTYHGHDNRISVSVRFFASDQIQPGKDSENFAQQVDQDEFFEVRMQDYAVPAIPTKYARRCVAWEDIIMQQYTSSLTLSEDSNNELFHMIGFAPIIETKFPHHMVLYGYTNENCKNNDSTQDRVSLHGWAIGEGPQLLPNQVGLPLGGEDGYRSFTLSMHYDNRDLTDGVKDSSGFRIYYTPHLRPETLSLLLLADPLISLIGQPIVSPVNLNGLSQHSFTCPSRCTEAALGSSPDHTNTQEATKNTIVRIPHEITVVKELLHMHDKGISMTNRVIRGDMIIHEGKIDYWDNRMSGLFPTAANFTIQPGDILQTTCTYHAQERGNTVFGTGSEDEMCIAFLYYYPPLSKDMASFFNMCGKDTRSNLGDPCVGDYSECDLPNLLSVGRSFGQTTTDVKAKSPKNKSRVDLPETENGGTFDHTDKHLSSTSLQVTSTFHFWIFMLLIIW